MEPGIKKKFSSRHDLTPRQASFADLNLGIGVWQGVYQDAEGLWLRWYDATQGIPTAAERAEQESARVQQECQRTEQERQRADRLAAKLRELGIDPEQV